MSYTTRKDYQAGYHREKRVERLAYMKARREKLKKEKVLNETPKAQSNPSNRETGEVV